MFIFRLEVTDAGYLRMFFNLLVVWLLTGLWHGDGWNFILWGAVIFVLIAVEKLGAGKFLETHPARRTFIYDTRCSSHMDNICM